MSVLFGMELSASASALHTYVVNHFGHPIHEEVEHGWSRDRKGRSQVRPDGVPVITINAATGRTEDNVVHELHHLYLRTEGFPFLGVQGGNEITKQFLGNLFCSIEHSIFFPEMRAQGFDLDIMLRNDCQEAHAENGCLSGFDLYQRAAWYFSVVLETEDENLKQSIDQWFEENDTEALARGRRMVDARFRKGQSLSAADAVQALVECSNICFEPTFTFQLADWRYSKRGNHNQHIAIIAVHQH